ncbi:beta-barrel fold lipoprotein [Adhaeribacter arboris]|uniref:beta-barrel fold lipoprotein n=1 Tax=Adhaeribacter arboris TaxID=2072846 RepID=UPI000D1368C3|nr:beta-barrel fold lipoprotein [Adhaeribacter arboris]
MRTLKYFCSFLILFLLLVGCGKDNDDPNPTTSTATFRVDVSQTGDYQKFTRIITIAGGDFKYRGTTDPVPAVLLGDNLNTASFSVEALNVEELSISTMTGFSPVETGPAAMTLKFSVYRNGTLLEEKTFSYTEVTKDKSDDLSYKAN